MSYFHERMFTIIGATAFHGPVRDGKGWFHSAMVIRHNCFVALTTIEGEINTTNLEANNLWVFNELAALGATERLYIVTLFSVGADFESTHHRNTTNFRVVSYITTTFKHSCSLKL